MADTDDLVHAAREIVDAAHVRDYDALRASAAADSLAFWQERAGRLDSYEPWRQVLDASDDPFYRWFVGGKTNVVRNALDRHQKNATRNRLALIREGEDGTLWTFSHFALNREVCQFASVLESMGVRRGDRATIYMPRIPELVMAMLATAKIGAVHSVVYGGFSVEALHERIEDSESRVLIRNVGAEVGPIAKPERVTFVESPPKTRSGRIMRRLLKARALGVAEGDTSTLED